MPEEFDPTWEYWEPNTEIAEVMGGETVCDIFGAGVSTTFSTGFGVSKAPNGRLTHTVEDEPLQLVHKGCKANAKVLLSCAHCERYWLEGRRKSKKYCSPVCRNKGVAANRKVVFKVRRGVEKACELCGREVGKKHGKKKKYCSKACRKTAASQRWRSIKYPPVIGG